MSCDQNSFFQALLTAAAELSRLFLAGNESAGWLHCLSFKLTVHKRALCTNTLPFLSAQLRRLICVCSVAAGFTQGLQCSTKKGAVADKVQVSTGLARIRTNKNPIRTALLLAIHWHLMGLLINWPSYRHSILMSIPYSCLHIIAPEFCLAFKHLPILLG